jgi:hypothetical protein
VFTEEVRFMLGSGKTLPGRETRDDPMCQALCGVFCIYAH